MALKAFQDFIRIPSVSLTGPHDGTYRKAVEFLRAIAEDIGLVCKVVELRPNKPILIASWTGTKPQLQSIMLNSHYDVVPVDATCWTMGEPFSGEELKDGNILGRGTQDMKCVCIQYLWAIRALREAGFKPHRTIHLTFVPDEEIGGTDGMCPFLETDAFTSLNVGVALDEGLASPTEAFSIYYGQRAVWWLIVKAKGSVGHGSRFVENTAMMKLMESCQHFLKFREQERLRLVESEHGTGGKSLKLGDVTSVNMTMMKGGHSVNDGKTESFALNVIPTEVQAGFDIRIPPSVPLHEMDAKLKEWTKAEGLSYSFMVKHEQHSVSSLDTTKNPWWQVVQDASKELGIKLEPEIFPAGTDSAYIRYLGIPAFGFSPMNRTPILLHDHNERLHKDVFLKGIDIYVHIIKRLATAGENVKAKL